jgi:hypothetical protein
MSPVPFISRHHFPLCLDLLRSALRALLPGFLLALPTPRTDVRRVQ